MSQNQYRICGPLSHFSIPTFGSDQEELHKPPAAPPPQQAVESVPAEKTISSTSTPVAVMYLRYSAFFALLTLSSVLGVPVLDGPGCPEQHGVQAYAHPEACDHFFLCTNGTLTLEQCENGLLFDGKGNVHNHCNYHWAVECGPRKAVLVPVSSPGCEYKYGIYPEGPHCSTNYVKCADGYPYLNHCDPGLAYDDKTHSCNWPDLLLDQCNPEAVVGFKCPDKVDPHSVSARFHPYPRYAIPGDCQHLVTCVNGFPRLIACEEGKYLDENSLTCEEAEHVPSCGHLKK